MSEWRTQAQVEADQRLHTAIADMLEAYSDDVDEHRKFMLTEYVVITARVGVDDEYQGHTKYDFSLANGSIPWHNMMGLMAWAKGEMKDQMESGGLDKNG